MPPIKAASPKVNITLRRISNKGNTFKTNVSVTKPKTEKQLAAAFEKVLTKLETNSVDDAFDEKALALQMAQAATGKIKSVGLTTVKGSPIVDVRVKKGDMNKTFADVISAVEKRIGYEVIDQKDLGKQLASLAASAKLNQGDS